MQSRGRGYIPKDKPLKGFSSVSLVLLLICTALLFSLATPAFALERPEIAQIPDGTLNPTTIPKYVNQLTGPPPVYMKTAKGAYDYVIDVKPSMQQYLPKPLPATPVLAYGGECRNSVTGKPLGFVRNSPGCTFEMTKGKPITVKWVNNIPANMPSMFTIDTTLDWANPNNGAQFPIPIIPHIHGLEVQSTSDGNPDAWFTSAGDQGMTYHTELPTSDNAAIFKYPNINNPATIWYHDHAMGMTRINVMAGLAGFYLIREPGDKVAPHLPSGQYEVPLAIQDRIFNPDGTLWFPTDGINPDVHPNWVPEFFGNTIMVNGLVWPNMNVDQGQYRFRLLDGSNARFYTLRFDNGGQTIPFTQIGTDGGYIQSAFTGMSTLTIAPGERADILVDFSNLAPNTKVLLLNTANAPFPDGSDENNADPATTGQIMQFTVTNHKGFSPKKLPDILNPTLKGSFPTLPAPTNRRTLVLYEVQGDNGPVMVTLEGQRYRNPVSELPVLGTTEEWTIVDTTMDTHPIHTHLVQFQLVSRQKFDSDAYTADWIAANAPETPPFPDDHPTVALNVKDYLTGVPEPATGNELAWKDTIQMNPGEVTTIRLRFSPQDGSPKYPFDATSEPGYVWHCHIIDHEDNEMMRPYVVVK